LSPPSLTGAASPKPVLQRLTKRTQFLYVRDGVRAARPSLIVEARRRAESGPMGVGFTASRKVGGAVLRNRAKRRLREAARRLLPEMGRPGVDYVLVARQQTPGAAWATLLDDLGNALIRLAVQLDASAPPRVAKAPKTPTESD
jgi:ribonuclease P protein component